MTGLDVAPIGPGLLDEMARVHRAAFPDGALSSLGDEALRRYYGWQFGGPHDAVAFGAFDGDRLIGFCLGGVFRGALSGFVRANRWFLVRAVGARPWLAGRAVIRERGGRVLRILARSRRPLADQSPAGQDPPTSFGVLAVAVEPTYRRRGAGRALLAAAEAAAMARGFERMHLTVEPDNQAAFCFYSSCGWTQSAGSGMEKALACIRPSDQ